MANHSSVLAWRTPGMGDSGGPLSMGSHSRTRLKWLSSCSSSKLISFPSEPSVKIYIYSRAYISCFFTYCLSPLPEYKGCEGKGLVWFGGFKAWLPRCLGHGEWLISTDRGNQWIISKEIAFIFSLNMTHLILLGTHSREPPAHLSQVPKCPKEQSEPSRELNTT